MLTLSSPMTKLGKSALVGITGTVFSVVGAAIAYATVDAVRVWHEKRRTK